MQWGWIVVGCIIILLLENEGHGLLLLSCGSFIFPAGTTLWRAASSTLTNRHGILTETLIRRWRRIWSNLSCSRNKSWKEASRCSPSIWRPFTVCWGWSHGGLMYIGLVRGTPQCHNKSTSEAQCQNITSPQGACWSAAICMNEWMNEPSWWARKEESGTSFREKGALKYKIDRAIKRTCGMTFNLKCWLLHQLYSWYWFIYTYVTPEVDLELECLYWFLKVLWWNLSRRKDIQTLNSYGGGPRDWVRELEKGGGEEEGATVVTQQTHQPHLVVWFGDCFFYLPTLVSCSRRLASPCEFPWDGRFCLIIRALFFGSFSFSISCRYSASIWQFRWWWWAW